MLFIYVARLIFCFVDEVDMHRWTAGYYQRLYLRVIIALIPKQCLRFGVLTWVVHSSDFAGNDFPAHLAIRRAFFSDLGNDHKLGGRGWGLEKRYGPEDRRW